MCPNDSKHLQLHNYLAADCFSFSILITGEKPDRTITHNNAKQKKSLACLKAHSTRDRNRTHFSSFRRLPASITVEAAIALPLFLFMMYMLLWPLKVMDAERRLQNTMESVGKRLAAAEYVQTLGEDMIKEDSSYRDLIISAADGLEEGIGLGAILLKASELPFDNISFSADTAVFSKEEGADPDMFRAELEYELDFPISAFAVGPVRKSLTVSRRAWVGSSGGRGRSKYGDPLDEEEEEEDRIVYLGKTSTVYHDDPNCHYLSNNLLTADASAMKDLRNESGGRYHACPSCKPGKSGVVYYFASGTAYHSSDRCKAITAYSRAVHLSEVAGMRACSYCGKTH